MCCSLSFELEPGLSGSKELRLVVLDVVDNGPGSPMSVMLELLLESCDPFAL